MSFTDPTSFLPLYAETMARIRARFDADVNAGVSPTSPAWVDTREGSFYWDLTQVVGLEIARLWDAIGSETVAAAFPSLAWGEYLDQHGTTFNLTRNPATGATTDLVFAGSASSLVATNTQVSAAPSTPSGDSITFQTTTSATTGPLYTPNMPTQATSQTGGTLTAGTYIYHVTVYVEITSATDGNTTDVESTGTPDLASTAITTNTGKVTLSWSAVSGVTGYNIYRTLVAGTLGEWIGTTTGTSFIDTGTVTPTTAEPTINTTAACYVQAQAVTPGSQGNLAANSVQIMGSTVAGITFVTNPLATVGGTDTESDDDFRTRILGQYQGHGSGNIADFQSWALAQPGVERVSVVPIWNGPGTVLVVPMLKSGAPVGSTVVTDLQAYLDPTPQANGLGQAPVGSYVTVTTSTQLTITVVATVIENIGYSLLGGGGTIAIGTAITNALNTFLTAMNPGDVIYYQQVQAQFFSVAGVQSLSGLTINGGTSDITLSVSPPQTALLAADLTDGG
jgi:uncharacterized phage protein gp47/JayE